MADIDTRMSRIEGVEPRSSDFCLSPVLLPSSRHGFSRDPEGLLLPFIRVYPCSSVVALPFAFCLSPLPFAFAFFSPLYPVPSYNPVYPDELVWTSTSCTPFLIAFASLFYYHIIIREKMLDTVFLIAYN